MYPSLSKSYKKVFPFKLSVPSYIYPDHILPNVTCLGPYVDAIELLLFESASDSLPGPRDIDALKRLSADLNISFNIHLPTDLSLGSTDSTRRHRAVEVLRRIVALTEPLSPITHTLHLEWEGSIDDREAIGSWQGRVSQSISELLSCGLSSSYLSIETLDYPFGWVDGIVDAFDLSVCIDFGHLLKHGVSPASFFRAYGEKVSIMHLHALEGGRDHQPLTCLSEPQWEEALWILTRFLGVVSIEVFCFEHLNRSLEALEERFNRPAVSSRR